MDNHSNKIQSGIKENILPFFLLVIINLFVGSMVGLERTILPILGEERFGIASASAALSFIVSFGFSKAIVNFFAGNLADRIGRKRVLLIGWAIGLTVPLLVIFAHAWWVVVAANILLGMNQALTWSMTVNMKVDLAKPDQRGLAVGFNEFAGYLGVALMAAISGYVASSYSLSPEPFYIGIGLVIIGFLLSLMVQDTAQHVNLQAIQQDEESGSLSTKEVFKRTTWKNRNLSSSSFAGLTTNFKDGMAWGLFPIFFASGGLSVGQIGTVVALYPAAWGFFQLFTGLWSDRVGRRKLIVSGMFVQALSLWFILFVDTYPLWILGAIFLGIGTAMVYPTILASISDVTHPQWRATSMGVYRFWRDSGYAFGALAAGIIADALSVYWAIGLVGALPFLSGLISMIRLDETLNKKPQ
ncbi:MFS transporter [Halobacillus halophilus]|uniref:MFS-type transporter n=1 Tax=Halobacillus halophilus (strain ATCC 35676 / DSM 2266 / JCM 20832 / KCTC 3685 / LMG 17431 / NBRC 102448 / NCIMB 2269) TaxID=866895 RepID=I0JRQ2_HALH3|nr:MFS transporter [Halobacillus halophilus]ASF40785.1 MFS transporter [Halobacillus halophilus]CCG46823.1 MFS-type transporter [Halobacillus halophilus DSM 2266]